MESSSESPPRTLLICHAGDRIGEETLAGWLASFSELVGLVVIREERSRMWRRIRRQFQRDGVLRFLDVLAFRAYYAAFLKRRDQHWERAALDHLARARPPRPASVPVLVTSNPNSREAQEFIKARAPDLTIARCKTLLKKSIFSIPRHGTYVMHPGICPEYRNSHGCFWALAQGDWDNVGMTLLRIDAGIDTGPVYGYYRCAFDAARDSHVVIQKKVVLDNLDALREKLREIVAGRAERLDTSGRPSAEWGQPWLSAYLRWKRQARRRARVAERGQEHATGPAVS